MTEFLVNFSFVKVKFKDVIIYSMLIEEHLNYFLIITNLLFKNGIKFKLKNMCFSKRIYSLRKNNLRIRYYIGFFHN